MPLTITCTISFSSNEDMTQGSIRVTDTTDWVGQSVDPADVEIGFGILAPDGNTYRYDTVPQIGNIFPAIQLWQEFPLPQDVSGEIQTGTYTVSYNAVVNGGETATQTFTATLCTDLPTLCIETDVNCLTLVVSVTDDTGWEALGWTVNSREMTLQYPSITYHANITGAGPTISTAGEPIWNGTWTATVAVDVTKGNYTIGLTTVKQFQVSCNFDGCKLLCMFENIFGDLLDAERRGYDNEIAKINRKLSEMASISTMIQMSIGCGDATFLNTLMERFAILATGKPTIDCHTCCDDCGEPRQLVPIWSGGGGDGWTPVAGNNITITPGVGTYTFSVSTAFANMVSALFNTGIESTDGSLVVVPATVGILTTYDLSVAKPAFDSFSVRITYNPQVPSAAMSTIQLIGDTFKDTGVSVVDNGPGLIFQRFSGFVSSGTPAYRVNIMVSDYTVDSPFVGNWDAANLFDVKIKEQSATDFKFGFTIAAQEVSMYNVGDFVPVSVLAFFLSQIIVDINIEKLN
jgi:hypothetical protein